MSYKNFEKNELVSILEWNNEVQPKAHTSNNILLAILDNCNENLTIRCELTRSKSGVPNRGSAFECLTKSFFTKETYIVKSEFGVADLITRNMQYYQAQKLDSMPRSINVEIKYANGFANASPLKTNARYVLLGTPYGLYLFNTPDIIFEDHGHIKATAQNYDLAIRMHQLEKLMGLDKYYQD